MKKNLLFAVVVFALTMGAIPTFAAGTTNVKTSAAEETTVVEETQAEPTEEEPTPDVVEAEEATEDGTEEVKAEATEEPAVNVAEDSNAIKIVVNGTKIDTTDAAPIIVSNRTLVPLRLIADATGYSVDWVSETKSVVIKASGSEDALITMIINDKNVVINKDGNAETVELDVAPMIINSKTMVPFRFIGEALGYEVNYIEETKTITLDSAEAAPAEETIEEKILRYATASELYVADAETPVIEAIEDAEPVEGLVDGKFCKVTQVQDKETVVLFTFCLVGEELYVAVEADDAVEYVLASTYFDKEEAIDETEGEDEDEPTEDTAAPEGFDAAVECVKSIANPELEYAKIDAKLKPNFVYIPGDNKEINGEEYTCVLFAEEKGETTKVIRTFYVKVEKGYVYELDKEGRIKQIYA